MKKNLDKIILVTGIAFTFLVSAAFHKDEKTTDPVAGNVIPKEKKELLNKIVGRWITQTNIHARNGKPASKVIGSDVWQWSPDGHFLLHTAYGIRDKNGFGGLEITGYNTKTGGFDSYNFNPDGSFSTGTLTINNNTWIWETDNVRTTGIMDVDDKVLTVKHEIADDGRTYEFFMDGVLTKGSDF